MKFKIISKLLPLGIALSSINLNSYAGSFSNDNRYETFNDTYITVNDILEDDNTNVKIYGNTLVNLAGELTTWKKSGSSSTTFAPNLVTMTNPSTYGKIAQTFYLKPNTTYTISAKVNNDSPLIVGAYLRRDVNVHGQGAILLKHFQSRKINSCNTTFTTGADGIATISFELDICTGMFELYDVILVEGDYSKENIEHFIGTQSSFESNLITQDMIDTGEESSKNLGKYKVEYKVTGNNKFDGKTINGKYDTDTGELTEAGGVTASLNPIRVKGNQQYYIFRPDLINGIYSRVFFYDNVMNHISNSVLENNTSFVTPANCTYIKFHTDTRQYTPDLRIQISEEVVDTYEPYKEITHTFYLNSPLMKWDSIEMINGNLYHVKRSNDITLNGNEYWTHQEGAELDESLLFQHSVENLFIETDGYAQPQMVSEQFITKTHAHLYVQEGEAIANVEDISALRIRINKNKLTQYNAAGFKEYLRNNPVRVIYRVATPTYEPIEENSLTQLFKENTYISNNSNIPANMEITVDRVANRAKEFIEIAKDNPTTYNISHARYWTNLMRESTLKDSFQSNIDITSSSDLAIEKKSTSANADVYVKLKNTLSLSLDTNNIIFDNVDSTQDTELKNAVNLTVSSSLPYRVNAYLEEEIYNSEKTATLDKSTLNIKVNNDNNYKAFSNTTDPILLVDNHNEGVDISHGLDFMLSGGNTHKADVYKTTIKIEVEQK